MISEFILQDVSMPHVDDGIIRISGTHEGKLKAVEISAELALFIAKDFDKKKSVGRTDFMFAEYDPSTNVAKGSLGWYGHQ